MRSRGMISVFLAGLGAGGMLQGAELHPPIWVDRIPVMPGGNLIYADGRVELHPKALVGVGYDSNVDATVDNEDGDLYARGLAGLVVEWLPAVADKVTIDGLIEARLYQERDDRDFTGGRLRFGWTRESALGPVASVGFGGLLVDDPLIETGRQVQRARYDGDAVAWFRGTLNTVRAGVLVVGEDFLENAVVFDEHERDYLRPRAVVEWLYGRSDGPTRIGLRVEADRIDYREAGSDYQDGTGVTGVVVVTHYLQPSVLLLGHAGVEYRKYANDFAGNAAFDDQTVIQPVGQLLLRWEPEEYSRLDLGAASTLTPTIAANAAYLFQGWVHGRWRLLRSLGVVGEADFYQLQRSGTASGSAPHQQTLRLRAGMECWARDGLVLRLMGGSDLGDVEGAESYQRWIGALDTAVVW